MIASIAALALMACSTVHAGDALLFESGEKVITVRGNPSDVISFVHRYQDSLWSGWRDNERVVAQYAKYGKQVREEGCIAVYVGCDITRKAFTSAIR